MQTISVRQTSVCLRLWDRPSLFVACPAAVAALGPRSVCLCVTDSFSLSSTGFARLDRPRKTMAYPTRGAVSELLSLPFSHGHIAIDCRTCNPLHFAAGFGPDDLDPIHLRGG